MLRPLPILAAVLLPLAVSGCAIPDLVAHTVKQVEKSREQGREPIQPAAARTDEQPGARPAVVREAPAEAPPPIIETVAPRESIGVEALPER